MKRSAASSGTSAVAAVAAAEIPPASAPDRAAAFPARSSFIGTSRAATRLTTDPVHYVQCTLNRLNVKRRSTRRYAFPEPRRTGEAVSLRISCRYGSQRAPGGVAVAPNRRMRMIHAVEAIGRSAVSYTHLRAHE